MIRPHDVDHLYAFHCGVLTSHLRNTRYIDYEPDGSINDQLPEGGVIYRDNGLDCPDESESEPEEEEVHSAQKPQSRPRPLRARRPPPPPGL